MFSGIEHFAIASPDAKRLAEWYVATLEFSVAYETAGNYFVEAKNGGLIEIIHSEGPRPNSSIKTPGLRHIAIAVDDFDAAYAHLQKHHIVFIAAPYEAQGNRLVFFSDPDGNVLHLIQRGKPLKEFASSLQ